MPHSQKLWSWLCDVAILWYEGWERSRGHDIPPVEWEDFFEAFLAHYFPREVRESRLDQFINLKQRTMSVRDYSHRFNSLARYAPDIVRTMKARVHRYVDGMAHHLIRDCRVASLSDDVDIPAYRLSLRLQRTFVNRFLIPAGIGSRVRGPILWGLIARDMVILGPLSIDIHLGQRVVSHHRCRDCGLIVIVS